MLSINSIPMTQSKSFVGEPIPKPEGALSFKGKTVSKEMKKFYEILEKQRIERVLKDPTICNESKKHFLSLELNAKVIQMWQEFTANKLLKKILK